ncbi:MAG TPA: hypothetical protein VLJ42_10175 [Solirubrobacteraceae bacterium]|nr:hypothetical protein [Solirubrobacteraceae bacterium]
MVDHKLLSIYLNDHLAGATSGRELAKRVARSNRSNDYGPALARLAQEINQDRESLLGLMRTLAVRIDHVKVTSAWVLERAARLKLNGRIRTYSPLSRLVELEALELGITGKFALWRSLREVAKEEPRLSQAELARLLERAQQQLHELENGRLTATADAFGIA